MDQPDDLGDAIGANAASDAIHEAGSIAAITSVVGISILIAINDDALTARHRRDCHDPKKQPGDTYE
jgi:hypothetical protein